MFMGCEFGQWDEWNCDHELKWDLLKWETHQGLKKMVADLNTLYRKQPALHELDFSYQGFAWIDCHNHRDSLLSYIRRGKNADDFLIAVANFTPVVRREYQLGVPVAGHYEEIFNSDSSFYGGSNVGNGLGLDTADEGHHGHLFSIELTVPPLGVTVLKRTR
jgi:1,4-alpha-glucan branching enzyme